MSDDAYYTYLLGRRPSALVYRRRLLYPRIAGRLSGRVADIGCGIGDFLGYRPGTVGLDVNARCVQHCREAGHEALLIEDGRYPLEDVSIDGAILDNVLEHIPEPASTLAEVRRALRPGGRLVVGVPGRKGYAADPDHKVQYDAPTLDATLAAAGFDAVEHFHAPFRYGPLDRLVVYCCLYGVYARR